MDTIKDDDVVGSAYAAIDSELDKLISSIIKIGDKLQEVDDGSESVTHLKDLLENGVAPYVAEMAEYLNSMEVE